MLEESQLRMTVLVHTWRLTLKAVRKNLGRRARCRNRRVESAVILVIVGAITVSDALGAARSQALATTTALQARFAADALSLLECAAARRPSSCGGGRRG